MKWINLTAEQREQELAKFRERNARWHPKFAVVTFVSLALALPASFSSQPHEAGRAPIREFGIVATALSSARPRSGTLCDMCGCRLAGLLACNAIK